MIFTTLSNESIFLADYYLAIISFLLTPNDSPTRWPQHWKAGRVADVEGT